MLRALTHWLRPRRANVRFEAPSGPRLTVDFSGTHRCEPAEILLRDATLERLDETVRVAVPGTSILVIGIHLVPGRADDHARWVARLLRRANGIEITFDVSRANPRWQRRFAGNLHRFGCIEWDEAISQLPALTRTRASDAGTDY